jgi:hypothetical protein
VGGLNSLAHVGGGLLAGGFSFSLVLGGHGSLGSSLDLGSNLSLSSSLGNLGLSSSLGHSSFRSLSDLGFGSVLLCFSLAAFFKKEHAFLLAGKLLG